ncbi:MAG: Zn-dependent hydrolase [Kiloniellales bacterium]
MAEPSRALLDPAEGLLRLMAEFSAIGRAPSGGVTRLAASKEDGIARDRLCDWLRSQGAEVRFDQVGNIFGIFDLGEGLQERALFCGSHLDSQPNGGRFDGTYGVLAAAQAIASLAQGVRGGGLTPHYRYLVVCDWTNEEGARFQPSLMGSSSFCGTLDPAAARDVEDGTGISLASALEEIGYLGSAEGIPRPDRYVEIHVEQGRILENSKKEIGLVTGCWGARKLRVVFEGEAAHTGPTPMAERKDALVAASLLIAAISAYAGQTDPVLHGSVGRMEIAPNSPNVVPDETRLWVELRSGDETALGDAETWLLGKLDEIEAASGCRGRVVAREGREAQPFDAQGLAIAEAALSRAGLSHQRLATIAGHDAVTLQTLCPATLLFIPSVAGATHSPEEFTEDQDLVKGLKALGAVLQDLLFFDPATLAETGDSKQ